MNKFKTLMERKFLGIKGLYWLGIFVALIAAYAFFSKTTVSDVPDEVSDTDAPGVDESGLAEVSDTAMTASVGDPYSSLAGAGGGTVIVAQAPPTGAAPSNTEIYDNVEWARKGVAFLTAKGVKGTAAQTAISAYLTGGALSQQQSGWIDQLIAEYGTPPYADDVTSVGTRSLVEYVRPAGSNEVYARYSDGDLTYLTYTEYARLGSPKVRDVLTTDAIWQGNATNAGEKVTPGQAVKLVRYVKRPDGDMVWAEYSDGSILRLSWDDYVNRGKPRFDMIPATDAYWSRAREVPQGVRYDPA